MSLVPIAGHTLAELCPSNQSVMESGIMIGCYSDCTYAHVSNQSKSTIEAYCCSGADAPAPTCKAAVNHSALPYNALVDKYAQNVYAWAYDDNSGTFTCDPNAGFTFVIS